MQVKPKKKLGQHFLVDMNIAKKIADSILHKEMPVLEVGAGTGALTQFLPQENLKIVEIDNESVVFLKNEYENLKGRIIEADFLKLDITALFDKPIVLTGNFPYNITAPIFFKVLEYKNRINEVVCMIQKEVAERISSSPGTKKYGILSVLLQAYYQIEYLFTVNEQVFYPQPKVKSAVIRLIRNENKKLPCNEDLFQKIVKTAFNQRRKMLSNSLKSFLTQKEALPEVFQKRPEQLSVEDFIKLCLFFDKK